MVVDVPHGPRRIAAKNQISLPGELLENVDLSQGDEVFVALNPDIPDTLLLIPARLLAGEAFSAALRVLRDRR